MKIKVFIERENKRKTVDLKNNSSINSLLKELKINPATVITSVNREIVTEDYKIKNKDEIYIHSVISGG